MSAVLLSPTGRLWAQAPSRSSAVSDASDAVIPGATVTLTNLGTGVAQTRENQ
ncbi:MAG: hypothetical protein R2724_23250 [Bryobacterales bacterium]